MKSVTINGTILDVPDDWTEEQIMAFYKDATEGPDPDPASEAFVQAALDAEDPEDYSDKTPANEGL